MRTNSNLRGLFAAPSLAAALAIAGPAWAEDMPSGDPAFLPAGAKLEKLVAGNANDLIFAEGPVVTCDGMVMWSDITFTTAKPGFGGGLRAGAAPTVPRELSLPFSFCTGIEYRHDRPACGAAAAKLHRSDWSLKQWAR